MFLDAFFEIQKPRPMMTRRYRRIMTISSVERFIFLFLVAGCKL
jgi:hypothetical protein